MSDLISRKALLKGFYEHTNGGTQRYLIPEEIWEMVELAPTAYDVDKVVEQLVAYGSIWVEYNHGMSKDEIAESVVNQAKQGAIEIVKKGGGSDD